MVPPPILECLTPDNLASYKRARKARTWARISGIACVFFFSFAIMLGTNSFLHHQWFQLALNVSSAVMAYFAYRAAKKAVWYSQERIDLALNLNLICKRGLPPDVDLSDMHNPVLCNCSHPDIVCHARENGVVPFAHGANLHIPPNRRMD